MQIAKAKKGLSLLLAIVMIFTMVPATIFTLGADENYPMMRSYDASAASYAGDYHTYSDSIYSVTFLDYIDYEDIGADDTFGYWDVSASAETGTVMSWMKVNEEQSDAENTYYDLYIGGEGGVGANEDSSYIFYSFDNLVEIRGGKNFKTSNATTMKAMFQNCFNLQITDFTGWDTGNVTDMSYMFRNCESLTTLDLSSFDTGKVTTMYYLFYLCKKLTVIYVGHGWSTENVSIYESVFNCCYAMFGGVDSYPEDNTPSYFDLTADAAKYKEDGGHLTHAHKVSYEITGYIPAGAEVPEEKTYAVGDSVTVENQPTDAKGEYVFVGWSTDDINITAGEFTMPCGDIVYSGYFKKPVEDIEIVGGDFSIVEGGTTTIDVYVTPDDATEKGVTFKSDDETVVKVDENGNITAVGPGTATVTITSKDNPAITDSIEVTVVKEYKVTYEFTGEIIPDGVKAPDEMVYVTGSTVSVEAESSAEGYVFSGWSTDDADVKDGTFIINNDVHFIGSWEKTYTVTYKYIGEVPEDAPEVPDAAEYKAGEKVDVESAPAETETHRFVGWSTSDAEVSENGDFTMPAKDVVLEGYFVKRVTDVEIRTEEITVNEKDKITLQITVTPEDAANKELTFESSDESVVRVDENGNVEAVGEGEAVITVISKDDPSKKDTVKIIVKKKTVEAEKVEADKEKITLKVGQTDKIEATVTPDDTTDKEVTFESSDESVVKVDENGNIEAVSDGEAIITVKTSNGKTDTVKVTVVKEYKVTYEFIGEIIPENVKAPDKEIFIAGTTVSVKPDSSAEGYVFSGWSTDDAEVIDGSFIINNDVHFVGSWSKLYNVTYVYEGDVPASAPVLNGYAGQYTAGTVVDVKAAPDVKGYKFSGWSTTDASVSDGRFTMPENDVIIKGRFEKIIIGVEDIVVDRNEITLQNGEKDKIAAIVKPDDATNKIITFSSSNEKVVKVDKDGNITAVGIGEAVITITSKADPTKTETVRVTVTKVPVTSITAPEKITIVLGQEADIAANVNSNATNQGLTFESKNESVVTVDAAGKLTSVGEGTATVIVRSADNPAVFAEITVVVTIKTGSDKKHYMVFGKTEKIGWYSVSFDGGETFQTVFGNSNLVVDEGAVAIIKANDVFGDPFTFYINGKAVTPDENGYVTVTVDGYVLVGALGIPVIAPDVEESLNFFQRIIKAIKDFFAKITSWFKK